MMRSRFLLLSAAGWLAACSDTAANAPPRGFDDGTLQRYRLQGVVVRRDDKNRLATLKHGPIADSNGNVWMEAMTMDFPVVSDADLAALAPGSTVSATVCSRQSDYEYWVQDVKVLK